MSRPALLAVILTVVISRENVSGFGFQLPNETQAEEFYTINEDDLEQRFEINQRGALYDADTGKRRYDNYQLVRVNPETDEHLDVLQFLDRGQGMVEMWSSIPYNASLVDAVDMVVSPRHEKHVKDYLSCSGMTPTVVENNLQRAIEKENEIDPEDQDGDLVITRVQNHPIRHPPLTHVVHKRGTFGDLLRGFLVESEPPARFRQHRQLASTPGTPIPQTTSTPDLCAYTGMSWNKYHRYTVIDNFVKCLAAEYPDKAQRFQIGTSYEGRKMNLLRISNNLRSNKRAVWIDGGIHAREWASPSAVTYLMNELLQNSNQYSDILNKYDIYILPLANPDGYEYSHAKDRLWRKTRSKHRVGGSRCVGVDPNRNWGYHWAGKGASGDPCDETFYGPHAFSEPETDAIQKFIMARQGSWDLYLTFHSYGQYILYPWGYARKDTLDKKDLHNLGVKGAQAVRSLSGRKYSVGSAAKMLYPAAGGSDDWAKGSAGIKYSYTIELPDTGRYGFILPASKAKGVGQEAVALAKAMISNL